MFALFRAEWLRFRSGALIVALVHLVVLAFLVRMVDPAQQALFVHRLFGACYALIGLLLGAYQMGSYRRPNLWLALLHRPMAPWRIAIALLFAGLLALVVAVALPMLLAALWQQTMTPRVVDLRHWLLPLSALQVAGIGYLVGAHALLAERRHACAGAIVLVVLVMATATGFGMLALEAALAAWLLAMVLVTFKPDLDAPPRRATGAALLAIPLAGTLYLAMQLAFMGAEAIWIMQGSHPNNTMTPPRGGHNEIEKTDERTRMRMAFDGSAHPDAALLREQIALSEPATIRHYVPGRPRRHELSNVMPMEFDDEGRGVRWVFSHDDMRFHGYRLKERTAAGRFGVGASHAAFATPPLPLGRFPGMSGDDIALVAGPVVYQYASDVARALPRIALADGESVVGIDLVGERLAVMSDAALYFFDGREVVEHRQPLAPTLRVPFPQGGRNLGALDLMTLIDGYLVVLSTDGNAHHEYGTPPVQYALRVREDGRVETLAQRALTYDFPALYRYKWVWGSPAFWALGEHLLRAFAEPRRFEATPPPGSVYAMIAILGLLAAAGAWWRSGRVGLPMPQRFAWVVACVLAGLPALGALWLLQRPPERISRASRLQNA